MSISKRPLFVVCSALSILTFLFFAPASFGMKALVEHTIPEYIQTQVKNKKYIFEGITFKIDKEVLKRGWFIQELKIDTVEWGESYEKKYERRWILNPHIYKSDGPSEDVYYDLSIFFMSRSCVGWLEHLRYIYDISKKVDALTLFDEHCLRFVNPAKNRFYDVIFIVRKDDSFLPDNVDLQRILDREREKLRYRDMYTFMGDFLRSVELSIEHFNSNNKYYLAQVVAQRFTYRSEFLHAGFGKKRVRDTYIIILTGRKLKLIIQTFFRPNTKTEEIEKELKTILGSITVE